MPTYEYACKSCGEHLEVVQSFTDEPLTECPACRGTLRKVFQPIGISFKGSGFYRTDNRSSSSRADASASKSDSPSKSESPPKSDSSSDSSSGSPSTSTTSSSSASSSSGKSAAAS